MKYGKYQSLSVYSLWELNIFCDLSCLFLPHQQSNGLIGTYKDKKA